MSKPLSPKSAGLLGTLLTLFGAGGILGALPQQSNGGVAALIIISACFLVLGTWICTTVKLKNPGIGDDAVADSIQ
ncbi:hypothetical protein [Rhodopirellula sallentina]|uniref:hypothetical protein n=1 Tax=Rhodopirellula sallentina TaxID=1263869 RepID=UPI001181C27F|nr:hypothetical protein [Rhodopirellula sallentina]